MSSDDCGPPPEHDHHLHDGGRRPDPARHTGSELGGDGPDDGLPAKDVALALFDLRLEEIKARETARLGWRNLWLTHHWPADYQQRCVRLGSRHVCRRCAALYPLGFAIAALSAAGFAPWPASLDPWPIWLLSIPGTVAYVGEATGRFPYNPKWQVATTLIAAMAFGRALGYELVERWTSEFWGPIAVFGGIWFAATSFGGQRAATASSSSSSVL